MLSSVLESPGKPATGSPSILKGYDNSLIDGSPSIIISPAGKNMKEIIDGLPVINQVKYQKIDGVPIHSKQKVGRSWSCGY